MAKKDTGKVRVQATRNLDMMNQGETHELDRDDQVQRLLDAGYLVEVDENNQPKDGSTLPATDPGTGANVAVTQPGQPAAETDSGGSTGRRGTR